MSQFTPPSTVAVVVYTHRGLIRESNEDCVGVAGWITSTATEEPYETVVALRPSMAVLVADGLGGHAAGSAASHFSVARAIALLLARPPANEDEVSLLLEGINRDLAELMNGSVQYRGAGTTVAGVTVVDGRVIVFNVGDSRVYRKQEQLLELLTKDDRPLSLEPIPVGEGSRQSSTLLQCLGGNASYRAVSPHVVSVQAVPGDQFLLCTDGLTDVVSLDQMESTISATPMETVKKLRDLAFAAGAPDNVSIVMLQLH